MKKFFTKTILILVYVMFSALSPANEKERIGFLTNMRELKSISDIMDLINNNFVGEKEVDRKHLLQGALKGMLESLDDPYSNYFTEDELKEFKEDITGKYVGVGLVIQKKVNDTILVVSPIEDAPGIKAGIRPQDRILTIDGESVYKLKSEEVLNRLKGKANTKVKLLIERKDVEKPIEVELTREEIKLEYVKHKMLDENIGYLRLTQFSENVSKDAEKAMNSLKKSGMTSLVLDLRTNPGGSLDDAVKISSMFIEKGEIVSMKTKSGETKSYPRKGKYFGDFPLVVLINGGSASASEIVSGAIKDYERGLLVGEKTFGKGVVQSLLTLPDGDGVKITIAQYYSPKGTSIHKTGIEPDVNIEDKEYYLLYEGMVTNINEEETKKNKKETIKTVAGEKEAEKFDKKNDVQLNVAIGIIKGLSRERNKK